MGEKAECDLDNIFRETKAVFAGDDIGNFSIGDMKADYEKMLASTRKKAIEAMLAGDDESAPKRKTAKEMGVSGEKALELVRKPMGTFRVLLFCARCISSVAVVRFALNMAWRCCVRVPRA